jgi:hypothetical protein
VFFSGRFLKIFPPPVSSAAGLLTIFGVQVVGARVKELKSKSPASSYVTRRRSIIRAWINNLIFTSRKGATSENPLKVLTSDICATSEAIEESMWIFLVHFKKRKELEIWELISAKGRMYLQMLLVLEPFLTPLRLLAWLLEYGL